MKKKELFNSALKILSVLFVLAGVTLVFIKGDFKEGEETIGRILVCIAGAGILAVMYLMEKSDRDWKEWRKKRRED